MIKLIASFSAFVFVCLLSYLAGSFIVQSFNPNDWSYVGRGLTAIWGMAGGAFLAMVVYFES